MLEEKSIIDKIEITYSGIIQIRQRNQILKDGVEISASFHRSSLCPGDDLSEQESRVVAVANAVWTPEVIEAYQSSQVDVNQSFEVSS